MRRILLSLALLGALVMPVVRAMPSTAGTAVVTLDGVAVQAHGGVGQVVTVNHTSGYHARVTLWQRTSAGTWRKLVQTRSGTIGARGLVPGNRRRQGSDQTPLGTYRLTFAFGTHATRSAWKMPYRRIRSDSYWVGDNASRFYNQWRRKGQGGFRWWLPASDYNASERLADYRQQYELALALSYNSGQVRNRGFAIFLHVNGRGATAGCVGVPRATMVTLLARLDPKRKPVIAIGR